MPTLILDTGFAGRYSYYSDLLSLRLSCFTTEHLAKFILEILSHAVSVAQRDLWEPLQD